VERHLGCLHFIKRLAGVAGSGRISRAS
jgi:hypothetical protein